MREGNKKRKMLPGSSTQTMHTSYEQCDTDDSPVTITRGSHDPPSPIQPRPPQESRQSRLVLLSASPSPATDGEERNNLLPAINLRNKNNNNNNCRVH